MKQDGHFWKNLLSDRIIVRSGNRAGALGKICRLPLTAPAFLSVGPEGSREAVNSVDQWQLGLDA